MDLPPPPQEQPETNDNDNDNDEVNEPPPPQHTPVLHTTGTVPTPTGTIATNMATVTLPQQRQTAEQLHTFLDAGQDLLRLNVGNTITTALIAVPETSTIKVIYGLGFGTASIGETSQIQNKFLALSGEGNAEYGPPDVIVLDADIALPEPILNPSDQLVQNTLTDKGATFGKHLIAPRLLALETTLDLPKIVAIPPYLVYDGLNQDLNAALVYERLLDCTHNDSWLNQAKAFLRSILVGSYRATDHKPYTSLEKWTTMLPMEAKTWRNKQAKNLFPQIFATTPTNTNIITQPAQSTHQTALIETMLLELQRQRTANTNNTNEEKKDDETDGMHKISKLEKAYLKRMCGLPETCDDTCLPSWYQQLFRKYQDDKDKELIIAETLNANNRFDDADIPIYPELRKMIMKRNWTGGEAGGTPKFPYACYGLTPFAMIDLTEDQIAEMEFNQHLIGESTTTTPQDIKKATSKLTATLPETSEQWKQIILRFTNLLLALFKVECPLYLKLVDIVKAIRTYSHLTLEGLPRHAKASILWIIHLQARHFAQGKMDPANPLTMCLPAFSLMYNQIASAAIHTVSVAGLPARLDVNKKPHPHVPPNRPTPPDKKPRLTPNNKVEGPWNPLLEAKLAQPMRVAGNPNLHEIARYCNLLREDNIVTNTKPGECRNYLMFGTCKFGKACRLTHNTATNEQAAQIIEKLETFITKPNELRGKK
jgi:hypothetical protein